MKKPLTLITPAFVARYDMARCSCNWWCKYTRNYLPYQDWCLWFYFLHCILLPQKDFFGNWFWYKVSWGTGFMWTNVCKLQKIAFLTTCPWAHQKKYIFYFFIFSTRPFPGLLPVLGPLGSGTDTTHQPSPALRLLGCWWYHTQAGFEPTEAEWRLLSVHASTSKPPRLGYLFCFTIVLIFWTFGNILWHVLN